jgi:tRNA pseudouridine32 synthase/23S rRNA pseudouridine746 synthase
LPFLIKTEIDVDQILSLKSLNFQPLIKESCFNPFQNSIDIGSIPLRFPYPFAYKPDSLGIAAALELQKHLMEQTEWEHNFGLVGGQEGEIIGKMFGVLVVKTKAGEIGYLASYSGKLAGGYHQSKFVPPVFDGLEAGSFLNIGMSDLTIINLEIKRMEDQELQDNLPKIEILKQTRKENSIKLQEKIFEHYEFLNQAGEMKNLFQIFKEVLNCKPPSGAGECAAPRLLQYAFQHNMKPITIAEFWWGLSPKSEFWRHLSYYPACREKCEPILKHMLKGIEMDLKP